MKTFEITGESLSLEKLEELSRPGSHFVLSNRARVQMKESHLFIQRQIEEGKTIYGVNTGFGAFSSQRISREQIAELQENLIRSHSAGVGEPFSRAESRAIMILRANTLARGHSGIRAQVVEQILAFLNADIVPWIPQQGSVGASGDLAPLSHLALALIGEGEVLGPQGEKRPVTKVLQEKSLSALKLEAKEGLALINGCQVMTAVGALALQRLSRALNLADQIGALSLEALLGSRRAFHPRLSQVRPHAGEIETARHLREVLGDETEISRSHIDCARVQDAYSLRCMPAVHGAVRNAEAYARQVLSTEANSSTDNPLVFSDLGEIISCGNFHGMPVAMALDHVTAACTSLASISEQRIAKLMNPSFSELPAFLSPQGGLNSGHMIVHVAAASLVSEMKTLSFPASVDTIPTSTDKEDHVSMGSIAARKFRRVVELLEYVLSQELLCATQALDFRLPLRSSVALEGLRSRVRSRVPFADRDRIFSRDVEALREEFFDTY